MQEPELHAVVDRLCAMADIPKPWSWSPMNVRGTRRAAAEPGTRVAELNAVYRGTWTTTQPDMVELTAAPSLRDKSERHGDPDDQAQIGTPC